MGIKSRLPELALLFVLSSTAAAQRIFYYSSGDCGKDASKLDTEMSAELPLNWGGFKQPNQTQTFCMNGNLGNLGAWEQDNNGGQFIYVDTNAIENSCQLVFYNAQPDDEQVRNATAQGNCFEYYRILHSKSGCSRVLVPNNGGQFGYS
jgi:hypothetical protein